MQFTIPGQLRGPETKPVMKAAIALRKELASEFERVQSPTIKEICTILRVGGSLGSFGPDCIEPAYQEDAALIAEIIVAPRDWATMETDHILSIIRPMVYAALRSIEALPDSPSLPIPDIA